MDLLFLSRTVRSIVLGGALALTPGLICAASAPPLDVAINLQPRHFRFKLTDSAVCTLSVVLFGLLEELNIICARNMDFADVDYQTSLLWARG
jgi:hypothetical protein